MKAYDKRDQIEVDVKDLIRDPRTKKVIGVRTHAGIYPAERFILEAEETETLEK